MQDATNNIDSTIENNSPKAPWAYTTLREEAVISLAALTSTTILATTAATAFAPWVLATAGAYMAYKATPTVASLLIPRARDHFLQKLMRSPGITPAAADSEIQQLVNETSRKLGWEKTPPVFILDEKAASKFILPRPLRWLAKSSWFHNEVLTKFFAAIPSHGAVVVAERALEKTRGKELSFVVAHELSHILKEKFSLSSHAKHLQKAFMTGLLGAAAAGVALNIVGISVSVFSLPVLSALLIAGGARIVASVINNAGVRTYERRADRNGLYLMIKGGDANNAVNSYNSAIRFLERLREKNDHIERRTPLLQEIHRTHPSYRRRIESLSQSFNAIARRENIPARVSPSLLLAQTTRTEPGGLTPPEAG